MCVLAITTFAKGLRVLAPSSGELLSLAQKTQKPAI
jgi:hypothetical protein